MLCDMLCLTPSEFYLTELSHAVRRRVVFGRPCLLLPGGVHRKVTLGIRAWPILSTWPSHRICLGLISMTTLWQPIFPYSSLFEILFGQKMRQIFRIHLLWKDSSLLMSDFMTRQHSELYSRTDFTPLLYNRTLVLRLYWFDFQMGRSRANAPRDIKV